MWFTRSKMVSLQVRIVLLISKIQSVVCFFSGKVDRQDVYQAPYVWVQFNNPKPNVLIHVICRVFAQNVYFDRKMSRGLTRFQIYIQDKPNQ